jgi:hypothetical protein
MILIAGKAQPGGIAWNRTSEGVVDEFLKGWKSNSLVQKCFYGWTRMKKGWAKRAQPLRCVQFLLAAQVVIAPAGVSIAAAGVRYVTAAGFGLRLFLPVLLFFLFLDVFIFCHEYHLLIFQSVFHKPRTQTGRHLVKHQTASLTVQTVFLIRSRVTAVGCCPKVSPRYGDVKGRNNLAL